MPTSRNTTKPNISKPLLNGDNPVEKTTMTTIEASPAVTATTAPSSSTAVTERRILVADDDTDIRILLKTFLEDEGYTVSEAASGQEALDGVRSGAYDLVLLDMRLPGMTGMDVLKQLREKQGNVPVILMTAYGSPNIAIQASSLGAYSFITKPFELDDVLLTISRYFERQQLMEEVRTLRSQMEPRDPSERIIGNSPAMHQIYMMVGRSASTEATVLITGETGTGKELVAHVIHSNSTYRHGPLIKVNCAALPETLLESELFGHEKGAFTNALTQRKGRFEMAHKGSIFLDEIGEMTLSTQRKLLRVLQEREFERVGGSLPIKVDTRIIAATNKNLEAEVDAGRFREDLYYRLNVIRINMPPMRERLDDIPLLVEHFLDKHRYNPDSPPARISEEAMQVLVKHEWPGNVRELENTVQRAIVLSQGGIITSHHILLSNFSDRQVMDIGRLVREGTPLMEILEQVEKQALTEAMQSSKGDRSEAARLLGLERPVFYEKLKEFGLSS
ncbi:MAG TPA: sigma-54 dependent transcriptional regulator [Chloroflexia bacterium]|nr:sigma-54 dependent transcriptional regulator [Chloroflexia bacterium]